MDFSDVFQSEQEKSRLGLQIRLLEDCERPVFEGLFSGRTGLRVLDIGCSSGEKTEKVFSHPAVSRVIGLERNREAAEQAQRRCGGERFSFYCCDMNNADFSRKLDSIMAEHGISGFDLIYFSFSLIYMSDPEGLLRDLRGRLAPGGSVMILEVDDNRTTISPDEGKLIPAYVEMMIRNPFTGDRGLCRRLPPLLERCGYTDVRQFGEDIAAGPGEAEKKQCLAEMLFSFIPGDVEILRQQHPDEPLYEQWSEWVDAHFAQLWESAVSERATVSMHPVIVTARAPI